MAIRLYLSALFSLALLSLVQAHDFDRANREADPQSAAAVQRRLVRLSLPSYANEAFTSILLKDRVWTKPTATVCFGPAASVAMRQDLIAQIISVANEWTAELTFKFDWGMPVRVCENNHSADIRVAVKPIDPPIFTSKIGNASKESLTKPGVNGFSLALTFPMNDPRYDPKGEVFRFYVLHEFGHALGFEHEHQRVDCKFDWPYVAQKLGFPNEAEAKANMKQLLEMKSDGYPNPDAVKKFIVTPFDKYSVMQYNFRTDVSPVPDDPKIYTEGKGSKCFRQGWVSELTKFDTAGAAEAYKDPWLTLSALSRQLASLKTTPQLDDMANARLTNPDLGRPNFAADQAAPPIDPDLKKKIEELKKFPAAIRLLKEILAERHSAFLAAIK